MTARIRIAIVEDHALTRAGMKTALQGPYAVVAEAADGPAGYRAIVDHRPDVAVIDLGLPGMDGIELTRRVRAALPELRIVIVTMVDVEGEVLAALAAGADAYCLKGSPIQSLLDGVRIAYEGGAYFDPRIANVVLARFSGHPSAGGHSPLTPRECEVLALIAEGNGNAEIATRLHLGLGTVKGHVRDILEKLAANDRTHAAVTALRRGYI